MIEKEYAEWSEIELAVEDMSAWALSENFKNIYGIPRGGLIVAVMLSHILDIPVITDEQNITEETLIVDDIADTGKTLSKYKDLKIATIYYHKNSIIQPDFWRYIKSNWVVFPWETEKTSKADYLEKEQNEF